MPPPATRSTLRAAIMIAAALLATGCGAAEDDLDEPDLGSLTDVIDVLQRRVWPGSDQPGSGRVIPRINGFVENQPIGYWFAGVALPTTADVYWFCREGDMGCPLDDRGALDTERTLGGPVFARIPGESSYSPYWWIKVIRVPDDYQPNALKSVLGIERAIQNGRVRQEWYHFNHTRWIGPDKAIEHSMLVLDDTVLEGNGDAPQNLPGVATHYVPRLQGWHKQYRVQYFDFTATEGVLPPADEEQEEWLAPDVPTAELYVMFRGCTDDAGPTPTVCSAGERMIGAVTEQALALDLTGDGDLSDTNNVLSTLPGRVPADPDERLYSPLWAVMKVMVAPTSDADVRLIDTTGDQRDSDVRSAATVQQLVKANALLPPVALTADFLGATVDGPVFFDCATQVAEPGISSAHAPGPGTSGE